MHIAENNLFLPSWLAWLYNYAKSNYTQIQHVIILQSFRFRALECQGFNRGVKLKVTFCDLLVNWTYHEKCAYSQYLYHLIALKDQILKVVQKQKNTFNDLRGKKEFKKIISYYFKKSKIIQVLNKIIHTMYIIFIFY